MIATINSARFAPNTKSEQNPGQAAPVGLPEIPVPAGPATRKPQPNIAGGWEKVFSERRKWPPGFWSFVCFFIVLVSWVVVKNCALQPEPVPARIPKNELPVAGRHPAGWDVEVERVVKKLNAGELLTIEEETIAKQARWNIVPQLSNDKAKVLLLANEMALGSYYNNVILKEVIFVRGYFVGLVTAQFIRGSLADGDIEVFWMQGVFLFDVEKMKFRELYDWRCFASTYVYSYDKEIIRLSEWKDRILLDFKGGDWKVVKIPDRPFRGTGK